MRFRKEVDPLDNLTAIGWKAYDQLGKASLFDNLKGFPDWQVCNQILIDRKKWGIGLGVAEKDVIETFNARVKEPINTAMVDPEHAPVKENILKDDDVDLTKVPAAWTSGVGSRPFYCFRDGYHKGPRYGYPKYVHTPSAGNG